MISKPLFCKVLIAFVERCNFTQRFSCGHHTRFHCKFASCNLWVRWCEWETAKPLLAFFPVSWHFRDILPSRLPFFCVQPLIIPEGRRNKEEGLTYPFTNRNKLLLPPLARGGWGGNRGLGKTANSVTCWRNASICASVTSGDRTVPRITSCRWLKYCNKLNVLTWVPPRLGG